MKYSKSKKNNLSKKNISFRNDEDSAVVPIVRYSIDDFFCRTVVKDFEKLQNRVSLATTPRIEELHKIDSIYGHACEGHGEFYEIHDDRRVPVRYVDITVDDVVKRIPGQSVERVKQDRQQPINHIKEWLYNGIDTLNHPGRKTRAEDVRLIKVFDDLGIDGKKILRKRVEPLAGVSMFEHAIIKNIESVIIGFYLGTCMDGDDWREKTDEKFGIRTHKGKTLPVDIFELNKRGITINDLQNSTYLTKLPYLSALNTKQRVAALINEGIIPKETFVSSNKKYASAFLELSKGNGISDDAAFITTSLLFGIEAGFGLLLADAIDTLDKYCPYIAFGGQDEMIGQLMKKQYESTLHKKFPVSEDKILTMIYLSIIDNKNHHNFPSCSQRRFWQKDEYGLTAVQSHMSFLNYIKNDSKYPPQSEIGFSRILNSQFYGAYIKKLDNAVLEGIIPDEYNLSEKRRILSPG